MYKMADAVSDASCQRLRSAPYAYERDAYARKFVDTGYQDEVYRINKIDIRIRQPAELLQNSRHLVVLRTEVCNISQNRCMYLYHDEPAMRVLMTYAFLFGKVIPGMPKLDIYDYIP